MRNYTRYWDSAHRVLAEPKPVKGPDRFSIRETPVERVVRRLLGRSTRARRIGIWGPRDNGVPKLHSGQDSEHLRKPRYHRFMKFRMRIRGEDRPLCSACYGTGEDPVVGYRPICCNKARDNCGGEGCVGPIPFPEVYPCRQCGGWGVIREHPSTTASSSAS